MSVIPPPDVNTGKFLAALDAFMDNPPRDLPDGVVDSLKGVGQSLRGYNADSQSPGEREVAELTGATDGTGVPYPQAARSEDKPSPGQREFQKVMEQAKQAIASQGNVTS
jgi:hypothetical protein